MSVDPSLGIYGLSRPGGDIVTLLDLTPRDFQDNQYTPLGAEKTWWLPDQLRRIRPFSLAVQTFPFRGPASFGQRFTFDLGSVSCGDILFSSVIQVQLGHWLDDTTLVRLQAGIAKYSPSEDPWFYANSLGSVLIERAELEIADQTIETVDGDLLNVLSLLFLDVNQQYGPALNGTGRFPLASLTQTPISRPFPTDSGWLHIPLPFFFQRVRLQEALPLLACREGTVRIHITFRPFQECVRRLSGRRAACDEIPLGREIQISPQFTDTFATPYTVSTSVAVPQFKQIRLTTYGAHTDGTIRQGILRSPFEILHRTVQTFHFDEPLKYQTNKSSNDIIQVQLPLEVNGPMEEIVWFVRRKAVQNNNEWTNYSAVTTAEYDPIYRPFTPLLQNAIVQLNGVELVNQEEQWFRQHIASVHKGGAAAYENFLYGYSFSRSPGEHQPNGTANASRLSSIRLTLDVSPPTGPYEKSWEVKVFVVTLQWLRFQDGIANRMFTD